MAVTALAPSQVQSILETEYGAAEECVASIKSLESFEDWNYLIDIERSHTSTHSALDACGEDGTRGDVGQEVACNMPGHHGDQDPAPGLPNGRYILKVFSEESCNADEERIVGMCKVLVHTDRCMNDITCPRPVLATSGRYPIRVVVQHATHGEQEQMTAVPATHTQPRTVGTRTGVLLTFVAGTAVCDSQDNRAPGLMRNIGRVCGSVLDCFQTVKRDVVDVIRRYPLRCWDLDKFLETEQYFECLDFSESLRTIFGDVVEEYRSSVMGKLEDESLRKGLVHNDLNDGNLLTPSCDSECSASSPIAICGLIDFSDVTHGCCVYDLARCVGFYIVNSDDPVGVSAEIVAGCGECAQLTGAECSVLYTLVCAHMIQLAVNSSLALNAAPDSAYIAGPIKPTIATLQQVRSMGRECFERAWFPDGRQ